MGVYRVSQYNTQTVTNYVPSRWTIKLKQFTQFNQSIKGIFLSHYEAIWQPLFLQFMIYARWGEAIAFLNKST